MKLTLALILTVAAGTLVYLAASFAMTKNSAQNLPKNVEIATIGANEQSKRTPVIVELFTSEGCSSCPPADQTLDLLVREQPFAGAEIIALSEHVDYWNRLGWTDPFASRQFSQRQNEYSGFFGKDGNVYTPQMIVDGTREFVGHNMRAAQKAITEAAKVKKGEVNLSFRKESDAISLDIKIENLPETFDSAIVLLAVTEDDLLSNVLRGENSGQKLKHIAVARSLTNVGIVKAKEKSFAVSPIFKLDKSWKIENLNAVVFVQDLKSRQILGAGKIGLFQAEKK